MMKKYIALILVATTLVGCSTVQKTDTGSWVQGADEVNLKLAPKWFTEHSIENNNSIFAVATEYSTDLQFAIDKANSSAKRQLASQMDSQVNSMFKDYATEVGVTGNAEVAREIERTTRMVVARASIIGFKRDRFEIRKEGKGYRVFTRMIFTYDESNKLMAEAVRKNRVLNHSLGKADSFKELDEHTRVQ
jgi:hypothetical protein